MRVDQTVVNTINKKSVINIIRERGPINKAEISRIAGLSIPTVMRLTDELIQHGLIMEVGRGESSGGKPPLMLEFAAESFYMIGIDVGTANINAILMDMSSRIVHQVVSPTIIEDTPSGIIGRIVGCIEQIINYQPMLKSKILGIGLGMPGLLDCESGMVLFSPDFKWENVDLVHPIQAAFHLPVFMINVTRAMAMGEKWFGLAKNVSDFMCINLGYGIGSAIMIDGELYCGGSDTSGELGHMTLERNGPQCNCGNYGCLEALASANAISSKAAALINRGEESSILAHAGGDVTKINAKMVFDAAKEGDRLAREIVREAIEYIGIAIASIVNLIDPELIILEGGVSRAGDILIDGIRRVVERRQMKYAGRKLKIAVSLLQENAAAIGAASVIIKELIENGGNIEKIKTRAVG